MTWSPFYINSAIVIIVSTIIAVSRSNWIFLWVALEVNLLAFLPILLASSKNQEIEATVKYFIAQAIGSRLLLISSISMWSNRIFPITIFMILALILKLGIAPCHLWYPSVIISISWTAALILSTWQKLAPLAILTYPAQIRYKRTIIVIAGINALVGGIIGLNQSHLRSIIAYSSITHLGWITGLIAFNYPCCVITYFIIYRLLITPIFLILNKHNINILIQTNKVTPINWGNIIIFSLLIISLGGIPPLIGFFPKLIALFYIRKFSIIIPIILIAGSLCNLFFYLNIVFSIILNQSKSISVSTLYRDQITKIIIYISFTILIYLILIYALTLLY